MYRLFVISLLRRITIELKFKDVSFPPFPTVDALIFSALEMSNSLMNRILRQAMITFSHTNHSKGLVNLNSDPSFTQNVAEIQRLTSDITSEDVYFEPHLVSPNLL